MSYIDDLAPFAPKQPYSAMHANFTCDEEIVVCYQCNARDDEAAERGYCQFCGGEDFGVAFQGWRQIDRGLKMRGVVEKERA